MKAFGVGGVMEKALRAYRRYTGKPLSTSTFRMVPRRELRSDYANLVRSIMRRSQRLLKVAAEIWHTSVRDEAGPALPPTSLSTSISTALLRTAGLGSTWTKMLMV